MPVVDIFAEDYSGTIDATTFDVVSDDYKRVVPQFLPLGLAWKVKPGGTMDKLHCALAKEPSRVEFRGLNVLEEFDPRTSQELLEDWERVLGLPDPCDDDPSTVLADRQEAAHAKLTARDEVNESFFIELADDLGYPGATIRQEHAPFECGISDCGDALQGWQGHWTYTWTLILLNSTDNDKTLQCLVRLYAQAHIIVHFEYPGQAAGVFIIEAPN